MKTVFLSKRRGAVVARLLGEVPADGSLGSVDLSFTAVQTLEPVIGITVGTEVSLQYTLDVALPSGERFSSPGTRRAVALTRFVVAAREACNLYHAGDRTNAAARALEARDQLAAEATDAADAELQAEVTLAQQLLAAVQ